MHPADAQLAALADPTRRAIFERLVKKPMAVGELARGLPVSRPAVSQHLAALKAARLVAHERSGRQNVYRANPEGIAALRNYLDILWTRALGDLKAAAEATYHRPRKDKP
ncbi:MAG TPA: metalloregulator ArsR/SmtB family transcription factor [Usitatibacter sp.]|nr:metalloregulator ArsR/SmtB family transcription factor [Usitatibacter sp.]